MIKLPNQSELKELKKHRSKYSVSIYLQHTQNDNTSASADRIELKNYLRQASILLEANNAPNSTIKKVLRPANKLLDDYIFWHGLTDGLALFLSPGQNFRYLLPASKTENKIVVNSRFDTVLLESLIKNNRDYYLLALGHKNIHIYQGDNYRLQDVTPESLPTDMREALRLDEMPSSLQTHNVRAERGKRQNESFHGQYNVKEVDKKNLLKFFRQIDSRLRGFLQQRQSPPLIVAGVDYLIPIYKRANTYQNLLSRAIRRNIEHMSEAEILTHATKLASKN